jgi:DNA polymerase-3 subunit gamma/tau
VARTKKNPAPAAEAIPGTTEPVAAVPVTPATDAAGYTVVARRYRPARFEEVIGQDHIVQALRNAIRLNKVTHAYLFSGTRGVGKTSMARIFAKCLNCQQGPTDTPCLKCDICQSIAVGQDVDVIEIDGASNNGVEAVRELRQNAGLRPSRARFKIYYIDEVHMLTTGAFNALLKTLEEPPAHVKFLFATTEPNKIPDTVRSRCQKYEFAGIAPDRIVAALASVCEREQIDAQPEALQLIARRASGSMRDAQSLLEQLMTFQDHRLSVELVHQALGVAPDENILEVLEALADRDLGRTLKLIDAAVGSGVQPVDLLSGVLDFLRDILIASVGAAVPALAASPSQQPRLRAIADRWSSDTILAGMQILAETRARMRGSPHGRILVESALCRVATLENLSELGDLVARLGALESGAGPLPPSASKKKIVARETAAAPTAMREESAVQESISPRAAESAPDEGPDSTRPSADSLVSDEGEPPNGELRNELPPLTLDAALAAWPELPGHVGVRYGVPLSRVKPDEVRAPDLLVIRLAPVYNWVADQCDNPEALAKIGAALESLLGRPAKLCFERTESEPEPSAPAAPLPPSKADELAADPLVRQVVELFEARLVRVDAEEEAADS